MTPNDDVITNNLEDTGNVSEETNAVSEMEDEPMDTAAETIANETDEDANLDLDVEETETATEEVSAEATALAEEGASTENDTVPSAEEEVAQRQSTPSMPRTVRRGSPAPEIDQRAAAAMAEKSAQSGEEEMSLAEKRRAARAKAAESNEGIVRAGAEARSRSEVLRDSRAREKEREARRNDIVVAMTAWSRLLNAKKRNQIQYGEVQAVEEISNKVVAVLSLEGFRTIIPFENFYAVDPIDYSTVTSRSNLRQRQTQLLTRTIGLRTPVLIDEMVEGTDGVESALVLANRKSALQLLNEQTFGGRSPRVQAGDKTVGTITAVGSFSLRVLVGGTEAELPKFRSSNRYIGYMNERFNLNQEIEVTVQSISKDENGLLHLRIDARDSERETMTRNLDKVRVNGRYIGRVTHIRTKYSTSEIIYHLHLQMQDVVAVAVGAPMQYTVKPLVQGDAVVFQVDYVNFENGYAGGRILRQC